MSIRSGREPVAVHGRLAHAVARGLAWSTVSNLALRLGGLTIGVVLARVLGPEQFGVYAVALTAQAILMTLADLGLSADLIRTDRPERIAPTVATLAGMTGLLLTVVTVITAVPLADVLNSPAAAGVIATLALTLALAGVGVVPSAMLQRRLEQKKIFAISVIDFTVGTTVTLALLAGGSGVIALAVGRVVAQCVTLVLQYRFARLRPRFGLDRAVLGPVLRFGIPVAGANLLSWALLNIDNVTVSVVAGPVALGFYVLAFNVSNWPMSALGQVVRSVALPGFARAAGPPGDAFVTASALTWTVALPAGAFLAVLSVPLIHVVYGAEWLAAAPVLAALGLFGAVRTLFDLAASYLLARGAAGTVLWIQVVWFVALVPATVLGTLWWGIVGAGWAHLLVGFGVVLPAYGWAIRRAGVSIRVLLGSLWRPVAALVPAVLAGGAAAVLLGARPVAALLIGAGCGAVAYAALIGRWAARRVRRALAAPPSEEPAARPEPGAEVLRDEQEAA